MAGIKTNDGLHKHKDGDMGLGSIISIIVGLLPAIIKPGPTKPKDGSDIGKVIGGVVDDIIDSGEESEGSDGITTAPEASVWSTLLALASHSRWLVYAGVALLGLAWLVGVMQVSFVWAIFR